MNHKELLLQWHISDSCNLRCKHCYQSDYKTSDLSFVQLMSIYDQFIEMIQEFQKFNFVRAHINVTGGEPFYRDDFLDIVEKFNLNKHLHSFAILSNGIFITKEIAIQLKAYNVSYVQVSLEGSENTHDAIRGNSSFQKAISGIQNLVDAKIQTVVSFTVHKQNYLDFSEVVEICRKIGVHRVWADRLIPFGNGQNLKNDILDTNEFQSFLNTMNIEQKRLINTPTEVSMYRALQFLKGNGKPYSCTAGDSLICILANGDLVPCRRMPIVVGNVLNNNLLYLYKKSSVLNDLRMKKCPTNCMNCMFSKYCNGGLKCLSYSMYGDYNEKDPNCWNEDPLQSKIDCNG